MSEPASPARVAVIQLDPQVGMNNRSSNLHQSLALATEAANGGANLIVLPELTNCGYFFSSRQDAFDHAEPVPEGASVQAWIDFASQHQVYLVAGLTEREGARLYNTAVLLGPDGFIGKYRNASCTFIYPSSKTPVPTLDFKNRRSVRSLCIDKQLLIISQLVVSARRPQEILPVLRIGNNRLAGSVIEFGYEFIFS